MMAYFRSTQAYVYVTWTVWAVLIYLLLLSYNPTVVFLHHKVKKNLMFTFPQGWGFFTRSPREAMVDIYRQEGRELRPVTVLNASAENYFGFSRNSRGVGLEMATVLQRLPKKAWVNGRGDFRRHLPRTPTHVMQLPDRLRNFPPGDYLLHQYKIIPLAWAGNSQEQYRPFIVARVRILPGLAAPAPDPVSAITQTTTR